jgi:hypothetical protein
VALGERVKQRLRPQVLMDVDRCHATNRETVQ